MPGTPPPPEEVSLNQLLETELFVSQYTREALLVECLKERREARTKAL
jgi:hypothetical protein